MLLATARFVITTIQRKFLYFFVFFFPKVPRSICFYTRNVRGNRSTFKEENRGPWSALNISINGNETDPKAESRDATKLPRFPQQFFPNFPDIFGRPMSAVSNFKRKDYFFRCVPFTPDSPRFPGQRVYSLKFQSLISRSLSNPVEEKKLTRIVETVKGCLSISRCA